MASITINATIDMSELEIWEGRVSQANGSKITVVNGSLKAVYGGQFRYDAWGEVYGKLASFELLYNGKSVMKIADIGRDANVAFQYIDSWNSSGLMAYVFSGADTIRGSSGADNLFGLGGNDTIYGGSGNDRIDGNDGADRLYGDKGADRLYGSAGNDALYGGEGNDFLDGGAGNDKLDGGAGTDTMQGGKGDDTYYVTKGDTIVERAGEGTDTVVSGISWTLSDNLENLTLTGKDALTGRGNSLNNKITGNDGNNVLHGLAGNDTLYGGAGNDTLYGGTGKDKLYGGAGSDRLYGGNDREVDLFVFNATTDSRVGAQRDQIFEFRSGIDRIDLSAIDANTKKAGDQSFAYSSKAANNSVWAKKSGDGLLVQLDNNGDAKADMEIWIQGLSSISPDDIIL